MSKNLEALSTRVESDPFFLAGTLRDFARSEGLDESGLANALGCTTETLALVRLCRAPEMDRFRQDIDQIAARFRLDRELLARVVRRGQAILQMRRDTPADHGMLLAARDAEEPQPDLPEGGS